MKCNQSIFITSLVISAAVSGCVSARVTPFDPTPVMDRRTPANRVRFYDAERPRCEFKELGRIRTEGYMYASWGRVLRKMRNEAHDMGGDAVISIHEATRITGAVLSRTQVSTTESNSLSGTVIRFVNPACRD
jgi:hypothetical protein